MHDDQRTEREHERGYSVQQGHGSAVIAPTCSSAHRRASASASSTSSRLAIARDGLNAFITASITAVMARNGSRRSRKAVTAISFAAFSVAGLVPPSRRARYPSRSAGKRAKSGAAKFESADAEQIERVHACLDPLRIGQCVRDRRAHVGVAELGDDRAVRVFDHRMHHALRMNHDLDLLRRRAEQPVRFDDFERLVHHGRRIHRNLAPHDPVRMGAGLVRGHAMQLCQRRFAERTAGGRQQHPAHAVAAHVPENESGRH